MTFVTENIIYRYLFVLLFGLVVFYLIIIRFMSDTQSLIEVSLINAHGELEWVFNPKQWQSFSDAAADAGISLPTACCAGACFTCCCRIKEGLSDVDVGLVSVPLVDIDDDQVLTCIGGLKDSLFIDGKFHKIVLQRLV